MAKLLNKGVVGLCLEAAYNNLWIFGSNHVRENIVRICNDSWGQNYIKSGGESVFEFYWITKHADSNWPKIHSPVQIKLKNTLFLFFLFERFLNSALVRHVAVRSIISVFHFLIVLSHILR